MNSQDLSNLQEAYLDVYEGTHPDIEGQTEFASKVEAILASRKKRREQDTSTQKHGTLRQEYRDAIRRGEEILAARKAENRARGTQKEQVDLYDIILSHLLDEGYADTQEQAEVIMVNMSEDWRESICEEYRKLPYDKMIAKSNKFDKQYKTGPTQTDAEYQSTTDAKRRRSNTFLTTIFHDPKQSQEKSAANKNRPENEKRSKTISNEPKRFPNRLRRADGQGIKDSYEYDLYDVILSHLLDEGYAETQEQAEVIMVNMSEDWRESIVEELLDEKIATPPSW